MTTSSRVRRLRTSWARFKTVPGIKRDLTAMAGLLVLGVIFGGYILAHQRTSWPWADDFVFSADFAAAPGISPGNGQEVRIAGVTVGEIRKAAVSPDGNARLTMAIENGHKIFDDATFVLRPKSPLNEMYVEINPGGSPGKLISEGTNVPLSRTRNPIQVDEVLQHLDDRSRAATTALLSEADAALANAPSALPDGLNATDKTMKALQPVAEALQTRREKISTLVTALSQVAAAAGEDDVRLARLARSTQRTLGVIASHDQELGAVLQQLPGTTQALKHSTSSVRELSTQLDPTLSNLREASTVLPKALNRLTRTVDSAGDVIDVARPVVAKARPVVNDLRPFVGNLTPTLGHLRSITSRLDPTTATLVNYLPDLQAFVYNTTSVVSMEDANGGILRGLLEFSPSSLPLKIP